MSSLLKETRVYVLGVFMKNGDDDDSGFVRHGQDWIYVVSVVTTCDDVDASKLWPRYKWFFSFS